MTEAVVFARQDVLSSEPIVPFFAYFSLTRLTDYDIRIIIQDSRLIFGVRTHNLWYVYSTMHSKRSILTC